MEQLKEAYLRMLEKMKANKAIEIKMANESFLPINAQTRKIFLNMLKKKHQVEFPQPLIDYIDISNWLKVYWTYKLPNESVGAGEFKIISLLEVFLNDVKPLWHDSMKESEISLLKNFRIFDDHPLSGNGQLSGFVQNNEGANSLFFYDRGDVYKINLAYQQYIEHMINLKGISGWQYLFCSLENAPLKGNIIKESEKKIFDLANLFPDEDFSMYQKLIKLL